MKDEKLKRVMTVGQLIELLSVYDNNLAVYIGGMPLTFLSCELKDGWIDITTDRSEPGHKVAGFTSPGSGW